MRKINLIKPRIKKKIGEHIKKDLNINTYNRYLFIFETILFVGVIEEFFEGKVLALNIDLYLNILLVMLLVGTTFTLAVRFVEPLLKGTIIRIIRFRSSKPLRILLHAAILFGLFLLYGLVYFDVRIITG